MGNHQDLPTLELAARRRRQRSAIKGEIKGLASLYCGLVLLVAVATGTSSRQETPQEASTTAAALPNGAESIGAAKGKAGDEISGGKEFDFSRVDLLLNGSHSASAIQVIAEAAELMHSLTRAPANSTFLNVVGQLLFQSFGADKEHEVRNQGGDSQLMQDAKKILLGLPLPPGNASVFGGRYVQIAALRTEDSPQDPVVALCSPRGQISTFVDIRSQQDHGHDECFFSLTISSTGLQNARIAIIAYPKNWIIRPLPSIGDQILNSRVVDVAIEPSGSRTPSKDHRVSIFFKPSLGFNTTKGCSFWDETRGNWTAQGCWVDVGTSRDVCHCNMSEQLDGGATGVQYVVYEYSEVGFAKNSYDYLDAHVVFQNTPTELFFTQASALMRNLSLIPMKKIATRFFLNQILAFTLDGVYGSQFTVLTNSSMENVKRVYADARKIVRRPIEGEGLSISHRNLEMVTITSAIAKPSDFKTSFYFNYYLKARFAPSTQALLQVIHGLDFCIALSASESVAEQNEFVAYMIFPVNRHLFTPIKEFGPFQVHNFRIVDVTLVPRAGSHAEEPQFIDVWYRPSVFTAFAKDVRLGCAYWSNRDSEWTTEGCEVLANATPLRCRFNLSAHFDDNREGGQYVVFEYSDVILGHDRIFKLLDNDQPKVENQQEYVLKEINAYLHNMTEIGFIDEYGLAVTQRIANYALTAAEEYMRGDANMSRALDENMHVIARRWAGDNNRVTSLRGRFDDDAISPSSPVALEAREVLSNEAVRKKSFLHLTSFFHLKISQISDLVNGFSIFPRSVAIWNESEIHSHDSPELSLIFSINPVDSYLLTIITFPASKMLLPISETLPPIFSYHCLEVAFVDDKNAVPTSNGLVTLIYIPDGPKRPAASTACAAWTGDDWSTNTCWPATSNEHSCTCNLSALAPSAGVYRHFLVYEAITASNFSPIASLGALDILYVISATASLIGLAIIALTAVVFPTWRSDVGHKIMVHLSAALFLYQMLRVFRETHHVYTALNRDMTTAFVIFAAVTHYSRLAHYAWMLTMSVLQLRRLLTVVGASDIPHLLIKVSVLAWGVPLVPLVALLSWNVKGHFARPDTLTHLVLYLVPGAAIIVTNTVLLVIIGARVFACFGWGVVDDLGRHGISDAKLTGRRMATLLLLFFLFGTPTVFEMFNDLGGHSVTLEVLFKVFDPVRGVVVFVFFVILDRSTFDLWRQKLRAVAAKTAVLGFELK